MPHPVRKSLVEPPSVLQLKQLKKRSKPFGCRSSCHSKHLTCHSVTSKVFRMTAPRPNGRHTVSLAFEHGGHVVSLRGVSYPLSELAS